MTKQEIIQLRDVLIQIATVNDLELMALPVLGENGFAYKVFKGEHSVFSFHSDEVTDETTNSIFIDLDSTIASVFSFDYKFADLTINHLKTLIK